MWGGSLLPRLCGLACACACACAPPGSSALVTCTQPCIIFAGGLVFDGRERVGGKAVVVAGDAIVDIVDTPYVVFGGPVTEVDTSGRTLLPGLVDAHVHLFQTSAPLGDLSVRADGTIVAHALAASLRAGVTSVIDMGSPANAVFDVRARVDARQLAGPRVFAAGPAFAPLGGLPCTRGTPIVAGGACAVVDGPADTLAVDDLVREQHADIVHVTIDAGAGFANLPRLTDASLESMAFHADQDGVPLVVEPSNGDDVRDALSYGVTHFAAVPMDDALTGDVVGTASALEAFFVPTLASRDAAAAVGAETWSASAFALDGGYARADVLARFADPDATALMRARAENAARLAAGAEDNFGRVRGANLALVAGSDAGQPGVFFGASVHDELARWVSLGASPTQALQAATRNAGEFLGRTDIGRIAIGAHADLLVVDGDPTADIADVDGIVGVWSRGRAIDRDALDGEDAVRVGDLARSIGETCVFDEDCASARCDVRDFTCALACGAGECSAGDACVDGACVRGDACDVLTVIDPDNDDSACLNGAACVPLGEGATRCVLARAEGVQGAPCVGPDALCAEGFACVDEGAGAPHCAEICDPAGIIGACANGGACVDDGAAWGVAAGHCADS